MKTQTKVVAILAVVLLAGCAKPADAESIDPGQPGTVLHTRLMTLNHTAERQLYFMTMARRK